MQSLPIHVAATTVAGPLARSPETSTPGVSCSSFVIQSHPRGGACTRAGIVSTSRGSGDEPEGDRPTGLDHNRGRAWLGVGKDPWVPGWCVYGARRSGL
jgi:hypothetical protein